MKAILKVKCARFEKGIFKEIEDDVVSEYILNLFLDGQHFISNICTPEMKNEMITGFLLTTGIIETVDQIAEIDKDLDNYNVQFKPDFNLQEALENRYFLNRLISSGCGPSDYWLQVKAGKGLPHLNPEKPLVSPQTILDSIKKFAEKSLAFKKTGAVHSAALFRTNGDLIKFAVDLGRHNAVDKVIGSAALDNMELEDTFIISSGRMTTDMVIKCAMVRIPICGSRTAVTKIAINLAEKVKITLIGFIRNQRCNIYTHPQRMKP